MLLPRVLTGAVGIPLILIAIKCGGLPFFLLVLGICMFCLYEMFALFSKMGHAPRTVPGYIFAVLLYLVFTVPALADPRFTVPLGNPSYIGLALTLFVTTLTMGELFHVKTRSLLSVAVTFFAVIFAIWPLSHLVLLRELAPLGAQWTMFVFICTWVTDSAAYLTGNAMGSKALAPKVSPKKTVEGFIGGIIGGALAASIMWVIYFRQQGVDFAETVILGGVGLGVIGQLSDLVESMLKREAKVKDSSTVLPGHGGFLDRFDSYLLAAPLLYYYLVLR